MRAGRTEQPIVVAGVQVGCGRDRGKNLERALGMAEIAVKRGAQIIAFAECFAWPWFPFRQDVGQYGQAERVPGPITESLQAFAKRRGVVVVAPIFEAAAGETYHNSALVIDADGSLLGTYRKAHIPQLPNYEEKFYFQPGDLGFPIFKTRYATLGVQICWDNFFPEGSRILALKGAQLIVAPTAGSILASASKWEAALVANAITNGLFVLRVNRVGAEEALSFYGRSFCVDPDGDFVAEPSGASEGVILAEIDLGRIRETRDTWPFLRDRRPGIYAELA